MRALWLVAWILVAPSAAGAQQESAPLLRVEVLVTAVTGNDVYLDKGRAAGLEPGDEVRLQLMGGATRWAKIRSVSSSSARAELQGDGDPVDIGATGEAQIPAERLREPAEPPPLGAPPPPGSEPPAPSTAAGEGPPAHPPWAQGASGWDQSAPLLAPISARRPEERPWRARGRLLTSLDYTKDSGAADPTYTNLRTGVDLEVENPFGRGDALQFEADVLHRSVDTDEDGDESETKLVVERLSYLRGGRRGEANRFEYGRFLHHEFPEFGLLDGVEVQHRFESGSRAGISLGFLPEPSDTLATGKDAQVALYYRHVVGEDETLTLGSGYQKSWHEGEADRDLLVGNLAWTPAPRARISASAWLDYYTSSDTTKDPGFELTQLYLNASYAWDDVGLALFGTEVRFPELLRNEFTEVSAEQLADEQIRRLGMSGWYRASEHVRFDARANAWEDEDDSGGGGDGRLTLRDLLWERGSVALGAFANSGDFSAGEGLRLAATKDLDAWSLRLAYDLTRFEQDALASEEILQHSIAGSLDTTLGSTWDLSLYVQELLRDGDNSVTVGVTLQKRF